MSDADVSEGEATDAAKPATPSLLDGLVAFAAALGSEDMRPKTKALKIDGLRYSSTKLGAMAGLELLPRVTSLLGPLARGLATGDTDGLSIESMLRVADRAQRDGLEALVRALLDKVTVDELAGIKSPGRVVDDLDDHFSGEYMHLLKVCVFALAHNLRGPTRGGR